MRAARVGVGGGAPGTRVCAYAELRATPAGYARQVTRDARSIPGRKITSGRLSSPVEAIGSRTWRHPVRPGRKVATPRLGGKATQPDDDASPASAMIGSEAGQGGGKTALKKKH